MRGAAAAAPGLALCVGYFLRSAIFEPAGREVVAISAVGALRDALTIDRMSSWFGELRLHWFAPHEPPSEPITGLAVLLYEALIVGTCATRAPASAPGDRPTPFWTVGVFAAALAGVSVVCPENLGEHGGLLRCRLTLVPPIMGLSLLRLPANRKAACALASAVYVVVALNLGFVMWHTGRANRDLEEFTAGVDRVGQDRLLAVAPGAPWGPAPDPLLHASGYYCLDKGNLTLDNYETTTRYFPVRFRALTAQKLPFSYGDWERGAPDVLILWGARERRHPVIAASYREIFRRGRLALYSRPAPEREAP